MRNGYEHIDGIDAYIASIEQYTPMTAKEEAVNNKTYKFGSGQAYERLVTSNLKFVVSIAKKYRGCGVPFDELISEGNIGLLTAAMKFDPTKGYKFITYAVYWIKGYINKCIAEKSRNGLTFSDEEFDYKSIEDDTDLESDVIAKLSRESSVNELTKCLQERELKMLTMYFGLDGTEEMPLKEIGKEFGVTSECARQVIRDSIGKLKMNAISSDGFHEFKESR